MKIKSNSLAFRSTLFPRCLIFIATIYCKSMAYHVLRLCAYFYSQRREDESRQRRYRRREGHSSTSYYERNFPESTIADEDDYGTSCSQARSEKVYQDLCSLNFTSTASRPVVPVEPTITITSRPTLSASQTDSASLSTSLGSCLQV